MLRIKVTLITVECLESSVQGRFFKLGLEFCKYYGCKGVGS